MRRFPDDLPRGVIPATLLAFNDDYSIDWADTRKHLRDVAAVQRVNQIALRSFSDWQTQDRTTNPINRRCRRKIWSLRKRW